MGAQHPLRSMFTIAMTEKTASFLVKHLKHEIVPHEGDHPTFTLFAEASNVNWDDENEFPDSKVEELKVKVNTQLKLGYETVDDKLPFTLQQPVGVDQNKLETRVVSRNGERIAVSIERNGLVKRKAKRKEPMFAPPVHVEPLRAQDMDEKAVADQMKSGFLRGTTLCCDNCNDELPLSMVCAAWEFPHPITKQPQHVCAKCYTDGLYEDCPPKRRKNIACSSTVVLYGNEAVRRSQSGAPDPTWHNMVSLLMKDCMELNSGRISLL